MLHANEMIDHFVCQQATCAKTKSMPEYKRKIGLSNPEIRQQSRSLI
jgi:hypothetical protein